MPASLYVFMGLIASGKSTLALAFANEFSLPYFNTDVERKRLAGKAPESRQGSALNRGIYTPEFSRRTYDALLALAALELAANRSVVLDGSYHQRAERQRLIECAATYKARLFFILCRCGDEETKRRLALRAENPLAVSDGTWEIYLRQKERFEASDELPPASLIILDTSGPVSVILRNLQERLGGA